MVGWAFCPANMTIAQPSAIIDQKCGVRPLSRPLHTHVHYYSCCTLESDYYGHSHIDLLSSSNDPSGNLITANNPSKDVNKYSIHLKKQY